MTSFEGQQEGERILYEVLAHPLVVILRLVMVVGIGIILGGLFWVIGGAVPVGGEAIQMVGGVMAVLVLGLGWWGVKTSAAKTKAFITDRRVVRLSAVTPWNVVSRSITWDEVVKIKTMSTNLFWQLQNIGSVIIHARSTVVPSSDKTEEQVVTNDDIAIDGIEYYKDLGNYLDKVLYLYKREPEKLKEMRGFVAKPKGKRY